MNFWCEINNQVILQNLKKIKDISNKKIISVIKGNAYGLDLVNISKIIESEIDMFAVSSIEEANKIITTKDILIMTPICNIPKEPITNYIYTIDDENDLLLFDNLKNYRVHIYMDSGMNRLGIKSNRIDWLIQNIKDNHKNINIEGIYTHLHNTNDTKASKKQISMLKQVFDKHNSEISCFHCLNSKGVLNKDLLESASFTNFVRTGNLIYGFIGESHSFEKSFIIKARVTKRFEITEDGYIGYSSKSKVKKGTVVGVIPIGTIDKIGFKKDAESKFIIDFLRLIKNKLHKRTYITFNGKPIKEVCEPNMNCILIDITSIKNEIDIVVELNLSPIQSDSSISKNYITIE